MNWKNTWNDLAASTTSLERQVGRIYCNRSQPDPEVPLALSIANIARHLQLKPSEALLDVCCGNGLLTLRLAQSCRQVVGVDFSPAMIKVAQGNALPNIEYIVGDVRNLPELPHERFDKICLNFSFQYFENYETGRTVIAGLLKKLKPGGRILISDIPDRSRQWHFYRTWKSRLFLIYQKLNGKNAMGKFWCRHEIASICRELQVEGIFLPQTSELPYSHYRFDYLILNK